jgi:hypothetical protein
MAKKPQKREPLVVASKMKAYVRGQGMMSSSEAVEAISEHVYNMLDAAIARAKANRRSTVRAQDL